LEQVLPEVDVGNLMDKESFAGMGAQTVVVVVVVREGDEVDNLGIETVMLGEGDEEELAEGSAGPEGRVAQLDEDKAVVEVH
jgi:hypothetical protein